MPPSDPTEQEYTVHRANELYWESDWSVNQIAEELGLSKGRLYDIIRPLDSGVACPRCGTDLVFQNRTALQRELLFCPHCELEAQAGELASSEGEESLWVGSVDTPLEIQERVARTRFVLGGALLGAAAGALLVGYLWKR